MSHFCKIGFHGGSGGNHSGIGDYMLRLDRAGIPFCLKSVNNVGLVAEAARFARNSGVPHNIILRWTNPGLPPGPEVPDYGVEPQEEAVKHWRRVKESLNAAPEFEEFKHLVWLETINEPRTEPDAGDPTYNNMHPTDWLGWFAHYVGRLANQEGYRWAAFGMNSGTPEARDWKRPGMVKFLRDCESHPDMLAVALHEYTFSLEKEMAEYYPHLIGRFAYLFRACDELGIARPTTLITEGGWTYNDMPDTEEAMEEIRWLSYYIAQFPSIRGVYLWTLEGAAPNLPNKLQRLIPPVTRYALQTRFHDLPSEPELPPPIEEFDEPENGSELTGDPSEEPAEGPSEDPTPETPSARGRPREQYERTYVLLPPSANKEWARAVVDATWDRSRYTVGSSADDAGIGDLNTKRVIAVNPHEWGGGEDGAGIRGFFANYYPGVIYEEVKAATPGMLASLLST